MSISSVKGSVDIGPIEELNKTYADKEVNVSATEIDTSKRDSTKDRFLAETGVSHIQVTAQNGTIQVAMDNPTQNGKDPVSVSVRPDGSTGVHLENKDIEVSSFHTKDAENVAVAIKTPDGSTSVEANGAEVFVSANSKNEAGRLAVSVKSDGSADIQTNEREVLISRPELAQPAKSTVQLNTESGTANVQVNEANAAKAEELRLVKTSASIPASFKDKKIQVSHILDIPDKGLRFVIDLRKDLSGMSQRIIYPTDEELRGMPASETIQLPLVVKNFVYRQNLPITDQGVFWIVDVLRT